MKFHKIILIIVCVTVFSVVYVYQQTQIFCLAYTGEKKQETYQDLLDKNNLLRYNVNVITSVSSIGPKVMKGSEFEMPIKTAVVKLGTPKKAISVKSRLAGLIDIFSLKAEAKTNTPGR